MGKDTLIVLLAIAGIGAALWYLSLPRYKGAILDPEALKHGLPEFKPWGTTSDIVLPGGAVLVSQAPLSGKIYDVTGRVIGMGY